MNTLIIVLIIALFGVGVYDIVLHLDSDKCCIKVKENSVSFPGGKIKAEDGLSMMVNAVAMMYTKALDKENHTIEEAADAFAGALCEAYKEFEQYDGENG